MDGAKLKLSTKGRYGLKAMVDLAVEYGIGQVSVATLARNQGISEAYLEQLIGALRRAGLINATRGAQGGYSLARAPEEISVREVLTVLEGGTTLVDCVGSEPFSCENACMCSSRPLWLKLQAKIDDVLSGTSINDLAEDYIKQRRRFDENGLS